MKVFKLQNANSTQAKYLQLAETVRNAIKQGQLTAGDKLPSVKSISQDLDLNRHTVMKSLAELVAEGWIESIQRVGYKVVHNLPIERSFTLAQANVLSHPINYRFVRSGSQ